MTLKDTPFPIASMVQKDGDSSKRWIVSAIHFKGGEPRYHCIGHASMKTKGERLQFASHAELQLVISPNIRLWNMLGSVSDDFANL